MGGNPIGTPAHRYPGGAAALAEALASALPASALRLASPVTSIGMESGSVLSIGLGADLVRARQVVVALPPALAADRITFTPALPAPLDALTRSTPVWMGAVTKFVAQYREPFWRAQGLAGAAISRVGPLQELHDMSGPDGSPAALFGFGLHDRQPDWAERALAQLVRLFGPQAADPVRVMVQDWSTEPWTTPAGGRGLSDYSRFGHPLYQQSALDGRLHWASTETAPHYAGHVEGALAAAERAVTAILDQAAKPKETR
ncbi:FAD-dependent oxidoreductase [Streptomyces sp. NBC_01515]